MEEREIRRKKRKGGAEGKCGETKMGKGEKGQRP